MRTYKNCIIEDKKFTTLGYLYSTYCLGEFLRADTLQGMKNIINKTLIKYNKKTN